MFGLFKRRPDVHKTVLNMEQHDIALDLITSPDLLEKFARFLDQAEDREVYHFNPRYLSEHLELNERATLKLLLAALYEGIVVLHWDVRCPACGGIDPRSSSLHELHHDAVCAMCKAEFSPHLDVEVRVTFSIHERLRPLGNQADDPTFRASIDERLSPTPAFSLLVLPEFQRLFPTQRLLPDESLSVTRLALIFTDLAGSTAIYARRGDPRAYHLVRLHFDELFIAADNNNGTIVKTIGDAILAVFQTPVEAMRAALDMQKRITALNQQQGLTGDERLILKVGLHSGPCLSVTLNERLDYFGTTVNVAARVQGLSKGDDVFFSDMLQRDREVQRFLSEQPFPRESSEVTLKGIDGQLLVHRLFWERNSVEMNTMGSDN
jgi:class 3 adenylate cyclase